MTPEQIQAVRDSFALVAPIADTAAELFYARLFELDPALKSLFKSDMSEQGKKLMQALGFVVANLDKADALAPTVKELAVRHVDYGVKAEHYATVGQALLDTLAKGLGDAYTDEVKEAWTTAYGALSGMMIEAAYS